MNTNLKWAYNTSWNIYNVSLISSLSLKKNYFIPPPPSKKPSIPPSLFILHWCSWLILPKITDINRWECPHFFMYICETCLCQYQFLYLSSCYCWSYVPLPLKAHLSLRLQSPDHHSFKLWEAPLSQISLTGEDAYRLMNPKCQKKQCPNPNPTKPPIQTLLTPWRILFGSNYGGILRNNLCVPVMWQIWIFAVITLFSPSSDRYPFCTEMNKGAQHLLWYGG